jgi:hypothetical protein
MDQAQLESSRSSKGKEYHFRKSKFSTSVLSYQVFKILKLQVYQAECMPQTGCEGSVENSPTGSGSRQSSHSRSQAPAPAAQLAIAQVALWFHNPQKSLDFSAGVANSQAGGYRSAEEEVKHYMQSTILPRETTNIVGYWMVCVAFDQ